LFALLISVFILEWNAETKNYPHQDVSMQKWWLLKTRWYYTKFI